MENCKIEITQNNVTITFADRLTIENSMQMALNLHRASNVPHRVDVFAGIDHVVMFVKEDIDE